MRYLLAVMLMLGLIAGCGKPSAPKTKSVVSVEETPVVVMAAAKKKEPGVKFDKVIKSPDGVYEVQGKTSAGKIIEVEVSESGDVLKVE
jgi:hypothetical protein